MATAQVRVTAQGPHLRSDPWPAPGGQQPGLFLFTGVSHLHLTQGWAPSRPSLKVCPQLFYRQGVLACLLATW